MSGTKIKCANHYYAMVGSIAHTTAFGMCHMVCMVLFGHFYFFDHMVCFFKATKKLQISIIKGQKLLNPWHKKKTKWSPVALLGT